MQRRERILLMIQALRQIAAGEADFAVFEDQAVPQNYVQVADFQPGKIPYVEVTCRDWGDGDLPPLSEDQLDALAALGFGRTRNPNHGGYFAWPDPACIAKLCESAFMILGSALDFDLVIVNLGDFPRPRTRVVPPVTPHPPVCDRPVAPRH